MKLDVSFKIINNDFNKEYADLYNWGEPGPDNMKYHNSYKFRIENVLSISQNKYSSIKINGINELGESAQIIINNVFHLCCHLNDGSVEDYYVSNELIKNTHSTKDATANSRFYFYIKESPQFIILNQTCFINIVNLPESFTLNKWNSITLPNKVKSKLIEQSGSFARFQ